MHGGIIGSVCFFAFLLWVKAEELTSPEDLKDVVPESLLVSQENESRSGAVAESSAFSDGGLSQSEAIAESNGGSSSAQSIASSSGHGSSAKSKATASSDTESPGSPTSLLLGNNRGYPYRVSGSNSAQASAEAQASSSGSYSPLSPNSPVYSPSVHGSSLSQYAPDSLSSSQADAEAQATSGTQYNLLSPYSLSPYGSGLNSAQTQAEADAQVGGPTFYNQGLNSYTPSSFSSGLSPLSGSNVVQAEADAQASSGGISELGMPPSSNFLYGAGSSSTQAEAEAQALSQGPTSYGSGLNLYSPFSSNVAQGDNPAQISSGTGNIYNPSPVSPKALRSQAQAQAQSLSQTNGGWGNPYSPGLSYFSPYSGSSSAQSEAQAKAEAQTSGGSNVYNPYASYPSYSPGLLNRAETTAEANGVNNPLKLMSPYVPSLFNPSSSSASAQAEIQASNGGVPSYNSGHNPYYPSPQLSPYTSSATSAKSSAEAMANGAGTLPYNPSIPLVPGFPFSPNGPNTKSLAEAQAQSTSGGNQYGQGLPPTGYYDPGSGAQSQAEASAQATLNSDASASASANALAGVKSRVLQPHEYIYPNNIYGAESGHCKRFHEIIYLSSLDGVCLVCFCMGDLNKGVLYPVCASCAKCGTPDPQPLPVPVPPEPLPEPYPVITTPLPIPEVTCSPLPSGQLFTNPMNPCQLCICRESFNALGKPDVQIHCQENPQCVLPPDVSTLPPVPDYPIPIPMPLCEKFPSNVLFPHPSDACKLCKCTLERSEYGLPERQITCYPNPDCNPRPVQPPEPLPPYEPITVPPMPFPLPPDPRPTPPPFPDPVTVEPIPWPPVTTPAPPPSPGPLPGPSPHESCRPFPPNQPFQHPWDDCQVCLCTEAYSVGMITVEVNCFTKKSCCIEPPDNYVPVTLPPPSPYPIPGTILIKDSVCEFKSFGVEFRNPNDNCHVCVCLPTNGVVSMSCKQLYTPECLPYTGSSANAEAHASADTFNGLIPFTGSTYRPSPISPYSFEGQSQSSAEANAVISSPQSPYYLPGQGRPKVIYPGSQGEAQAQAKAQAQSQGSGQSSASAEAEANANSGYQQQTYGSNLTPGSYISPGLGGGGYPGSSFSADAQAQVQNMRFKYPSYGGYDQGQALMNAISGLNYNKYGQRIYQGVPASVLYPTLYSRPSHEVTPLYQPGLFRDASAQAQAQSQSSGFNAESQAAASAVSEGRYQTRSGNQDDDMFE